MYGSISGCRARGAVGSTHCNPMQSPTDSASCAPIASLKFLDDLCTAYAWLQINGYGLETISEYAAMLRYQSFPDGRYPRPLLALRIPSDALRNPRVDELALGHFVVTARTFILLHELGHVYYRHRGSTIANEEQADRFAAEVMARTPLPPLGIIVFFLFDAHWSSYPPGPADTHPMSGARLQALAGLVEDGAGRGPTQAGRPTGRSRDSRWLRRHGPCREFWLPLLRGGLANYLEPGPAPRPACYLVPRSRVAMSARACSLTSRHPIRSR